MFNFRHSSRTSFSSRFCIIVICFLLLFSSIYLYTRKSVCIICILQLFSILNLNISQVYLIHLIIKRFKPLFCSGFCFVFNYFSSNCCCLALRLVLTSCLNLFVAHFFRYSLRNINSGKFGLVDGPNADLHSLYI